MSDDEFVEKVRRDLSRSRTIYIWLSIFLVSALLISLWMTEHLVTSTRDIFHGYGGVDPGLILGFIFGTFLSLTLISVFHHTVQAVSMAMGKGYVARLMKLMVQYYDQRQQNISKTEPDAAAGR